MLVYQLMEHKKYPYRILPKYLSVVTAKMHKLAGYSHLKIIYKGFFKSFIVLYADRICPEHHFVENRIENSSSVQKLQ